MNAWLTPVLLFASVLLAFGAVNVIALVIAAPIIGQAMADGLEGRRAGRRRRRTQRPAPAPAAPVVAAAPAGRWDDTDTQPSMPRIPAAPSPGDITASHRRLR